MAVMHNSGVIPAVDLFGRHVRHGVSDLLLGLGAPLAILDQLKSLVWSSATDAVAEVGALREPQRLYLIASDHLPMRQLLASGTASLSRQYRSGAFHRAYDLLWTTQDEVRPTEWIVLVPSGPQQESDGRLSAAAMDLAKSEHRHNRAVTRCGAELLPDYGGIALILGTPAEHGHQPPQARIGHLWRRKHATLEDVVAQGGLSGGALLAGSPVSLDDIAQILLRLARLYQRLHALDMVYTDPKPANIAFDLTTDATTATPTHALGRLGRGVSKLVRGSVAQLRRPFITSAPAARIGGLSFIDAESLQCPGYARDHTRPADTAMTPSWTSPQVLCCLGTDHELKRTQASEASDVFHMAAIGYALITGHAPQSQLMDRRFRTAYLGDTTRATPNGQPTSRFAQIAVEVRVQRDFSADHERLRVLVAEGTIPPELGAVLSNGLTGAITTLAEWTRRLAGAGVAETLPTAQSA